MNNIQFIKKPIFIRLSKTRFLTFYPWKWKIGITDGWFFIFGLEISRYQRFDYHFVKSYHIGTNYIRYAWFRLVWES